MWKNTPGFSSIKKVFHGYSKTLTADAGFMCPISTNLIK